MGFAFEERQTQGDSGWSSLQIPRAAHTRKLVAGFPPDRLAIVLLKGRAKLLQLGRQVLITGQDGRLVSGRKGDLANGRFVELQFAEHGFGGTVAMEKTE